LAGLQYYTVTKNNNPPKKETRHEIKAGEGPLCLVAERFMKFCDGYTDYFVAARHNVSGKARSYLAGLLMKSPRKNMERMEEYVSEYDYQAQQQFLSDSPWDHRKLLERIGRDVDSVMGGPDSALIIDESAFAKKGTKSVGVARQWNGCEGKVDNCQVGVFAGLSDGSQCGLVDVRLYLPKAWASDTKRCEAARIPPEQCAYRSKAELALEMVDAALANGLHFGWVNVDSGYGNVPWLLRAIDDRGVQFVADVHRNQRVYLSDPRPYLPRRKKPTGRKYTKRRSRTEPVEISTLFEDIPSNSWHRIAVRSSTKGPLKVLAKRRRVFVWDGEEEQARECWAVCIRNPDNNETKWFVSNAPRSETLGSLVGKHAVRYWIERAFQDTKTSLGMADYQARGWLAWHHHIALVLLAFLFMLRERKIHCTQIDLLSCQDIVELLNVYLPRADATEEEVLRSIKRRHERRRQAIESKARKTAMGNARLQT